MNAWEEAFIKIREKGKSALIVGPPDSGKTTFSLRLVNFLVDQGNIVGIVDADIGQSDIGPPTTIGLGIVKEKLTHLTEVTPKSLYFVGRVSPEGRFLETLVGTKKLFQKAFELGAEKVVVDTSGLVSWPQGIKLKFYKIELLKPDHLVITEGTESLTKLVSLCQNTSINIIQLQKPPSVRKKSFSERASFRERRFREYFKNSSIVSLPFSQFQTFNTLSLPASYISKETLKNTLVGLGSSYDEIKGLGIIQEINPKEKIFQIKLPASLSSERMTHLTLSDFKLEI
jgi:polynucleotide 5'-hydroxyl-kinase GRC3/NOL9